MGNKSRFYPKSVVLLPRLRWLTLPDVMHDILEGSLQHEVKLMLQVMVNRERYFSLNMQIENFELGYMEAKNRPSPIAAKKFNSSGKSLKQNGMFVII